MPVQGCTLPFTFYIGVRLHDSLREEHRLKGFANRILRTTVGPEAEEVTRGRKNGITKTVRFFSPDISQVTNQRAMKFTGHLEGLREKRNTHKVLVGKPEEKALHKRPR